MSRLVLIHCYTKDYGPRLATLAPPQRNSTQPSVNQRGESAWLGSSLEVTFDPEETAGNGKRRHQQTSCDLRMWAC